MQYNRIYIGTIETPQGPILWVKILHYYNIDVTNTMYIQ